MGETKKATTVYVLEHSLKVHTSNRYTGHALYSYTDEGDADKTIRQWASNPWCIVKAIEIYNEATGDTMRVTQHAVEIEGDPHEMNHATYYKRVRKALEAIR